VNIKYNLHTITLPISIANLDYALQKIEYTSITARYVPIGKKNRGFEANDYRTFRFEGRTLHRAHFWGKDILLRSSSIFSSSPSSYRTSGSGSMGGGGGGGTLGRRLGRPFSPAARDRNQPGRSHSREGGSCMRHMSPGGGTTSGGLSVLYPASTGTPVPQIESPTVSSAPPSLGVQVAQVKATLYIVNCFNFLKQNKKCRRNLYSFIGSLSS
jgi:hypothetical protein